MPDIDWRDLPSLSSLRAFEATARLDGFSAAARALNVTPAAVAQQVRGLEAELGVTLVRRQGRGLVLTPEGAGLVAALTDGFGTIAEAVNRVRQDEAQRSVRVSTTQGFAQWVMMPGLARFWEAHPDIRVSMDITSKLADLGDGRIDIAIRSSPADFSWPGTESELLMRSRYILIGAPDLAARVRTTADLQNLPWIFDPRNGSEPRWLAQLGLDPKTLRVTEIASPVLEVASAVQGYGLMFGVESIVRTELEAGRLVEIPCDILPEAAYFIVTAPGPRRQRVQVFIDWLKASFGTGS